MIICLSSVGGAQVSAPEEFEYKQKQELGCLGGRTYVKVEDEGDDEPPCAVPAPRKRSKLEHDLKVGHAALTLDQRTVDNLYAHVSSAARAAVQQGIKPKPGSQDAYIARLGKEKDTLQQRVGHLQSTVDVLQADLPPTLPANAFILARLAIRKRCKEPNTCPRGIGALVYHRQRTVELHEVCLALHPPFDTQYALLVPLRGPLSHDAL